MNEQPLFAVTCDLDTNELVARATTGYGTGHELARIKATDEPASYAELAKKAAAALVKMYN